MARSAMVVMLVAFTVLLAFSSQVEAQCKSIPTNQLQQCLNSIRNGNCDSGCRSALQPYASESPQCICQLVSQAANLGASFGVTKAAIEKLIRDCGQPSPNCR